MEANVGELPIIQDHGSSLWLVVHANVLAKCVVQDPGFEATGGLQPGGRAAHPGLHRPRLLPDLRQLRLWIQHGRQCHHRYIGHS